MAGGELGRKGKNLLAEQAVYTAYGIVPMVSLKLWRTTFVLSKSWGKSVNKKVALFV